MNTGASIDTTDKEVTFTGRGITSRQDVCVKIRRADTGHGIVFRLPDRSDSTARIDVKAHYSNVVNTLRNVTLGNERTRICIVEHFLAAAALCGLEDLLVEVDGMELPLGDGSASFWVDLFEQCNWRSPLPAARRELVQPVFCRRGDRLLMAIPDDRFSVNYMIDFQHPLIGKRWGSWSADLEIRQIADARTFGFEQEHKMLGLFGQVVSMTAEGFDQPLRWPDEPVRHKILDLLGDLFLCGVNPLQWKARFISIKGGHELDVDMAGQLAAILN